MEKRKTMTRFLFLALFAITLFTLAACGDKKPTDPTLQVESIQSVLETKTRNAEVLVEGTIYYVQNNGFYISDSPLGKIFVSTGTNYTGPVDIALGKQVRVQGTLRINADKYEIINVSDITLVSETGTLPEAQPSTVQTLLSMSPTTKTGNWYRYVELKGKIEVDTATLLTKFIDDAGHEISFTTNSNVQALQAKMGERVTVKAVVSEFSTFGNVWRLTFTGSESAIIASPFTVSEVTNMLNTWIPTVVPTQVKGSLTLPSTYAKIDDLLITWTTSIPEAIEILPLAENQTNYRTNVVLPDNDIPGTLTATVQYRDETPFTIERSVTVQKLVPTDLKAAIESGDFIVMVEAVVVGFASSQTDSYRSYILQDKNDPTVTITADFNRVVGSDYGLYTLADAAIGDIVIVAGTLRTTGRPAIVDPIVATKTGNTQAPVYDLANAPALTDQTSWQTFPGHNTLVKLVNPYMRYSTSSMPGETNWIRLGHSDTSLGTSYGPNRNKSFAFLIRPVDQLLGQEWRLDLAVPTTGGVPVMYDGDIYAYIVFESDTYFQLVIVDASHVVPSPRLAAKMDTLASVPTRHEEGNIGLLMQHPSVTGNIAWTSSHPNIINSAGEVNFPELDTVVTLTATFTVDSEEITVSRDVLVVGQIKIVLSVSEALATLEHDDQFNVEGLVLTAGYNTVGGLSDIFLQDKVTGEILIVQNLTGFGDTINIGDLIEFNGRFVISDSTNEMGKKFVNYQSNLVVLATNQPLVDYKSNAIVIDSQEAALALLATEQLVFGGVYKFTGNYFVNGTASAYSGTGSLNARFHVNPLATSIAGIRYGAAKNLVMNDSGNRPILGDNWVEDILGINAANYPGTTYPGFSYFGSFYVILKNGSASYYYFSAISADDFQPLDNAEIVEREIITAVPTSIAAGNLTLPTTNELTDSGITWSSSNPIVISSTGVVKYGSSDISVTLTATYMVDTVEYSVEIDVDVLALQTQTVTQVIASATNDEVVKVKGTVVGFHWNGSGTVNSGTNGVMIKAAGSNDLIYVLGLYGNYGSTRAVYTVGEDTLALGDEIEFVATYSIDTAAGFVGRKTLTIQSAEASGLTILSRSNAYSFDTTAATVINSDAGLNNLAENLEYGKLFKLEGAFSFRSSVSSYGTGANLVPSFANATDTDFNRTVTWIARPQRFSFKLDGNIPNLGNDWWVNSLNINAENFGDTSTTGHVYDATSSIYFYVGSALPTATTSFGYIQLVILDASHINATRVFPTT